VDDDKLNWGVLIGWIIAAITTVTAEYWDSPSTKGLQIAGIVISGFFAILRWKNRNPFVFVHEPTDWNEVVESTSSGEDDRSWDLRIPRRRHKKGKNPQVIPRHRAEDGTYAEIGVYCSVDDDGCVRINANRNYEGKIIIK
jgi:hypothetical protein